MSTENNNQFQSTFGFLMAAVGSAVGVGNLWGFPYKMGANGGFAFLLCYIVLVAIAGFVIMVGELTIGRKTGKGVLENYRATGKHNAFIGYFAIISIVLLGGFCVTLTAYCMKYFVANIGTLFHAGWGINGADPMEYWNGFLQSGGEAAVFSIISGILTMIILFKGVAGIERFCKVAMPALVVMLAIVIVKSVSLPGASAGLEFMFKPDWSVFAGKGFITVLAKAGSQAFFSLSLAMAIMVTYGAYMNKKENIERNAMVVCISDTVVALMAGCAIFPAVFAFGHEPTGGTALLFGTLQGVFNEMGTVGPIFGAILYLLVVIAELTSLVSIFEAPIAFLKDAYEERGKTISRTKLVIIVTVIDTLIGVLVAFDALGQGGLYQPLGFCWLDFLDLLSEGLLMPIGAFAMSVVIGWKLGEKWMADEIELEGNVWKTKKFTMFCMKFVAPVFTLFILAGQISSFFGLGWFD